MPTIKHRTKDLRRELWVAYLNEHKVSDQHLTEAQLRAVYRWRHEGCSPSFFKADEFLIRVFGWTIQDYLVWAEVRGENPYYGPAPAFEVSHAPAA